MTTRSPKAPASKRAAPRPRLAPAPGAAARPARVPAPRSIAVRASPRAGGLARLLTGLSGLGARAGAALGEAYARAASSVLGGVERLEDLDAERRYARRAKSAANDAVSAPPAAHAHDSLPPATSA